MHRPRPNAYQDDWPDDQSVLLFDGVCGFCSASIRFVARRSPHAALRFCPMQSDPGRRLLRRFNLPLEDYESLALIEAGTVRLKSDAVLRLGQLMTFPWPLLVRIARRIPTTLRDRLYERLARNRYRILGREDRCMVPSQDLAERFLA